MLGMPELWDICQGELHTGSGVSLKERSVLPSAKLEVQSHPSVLTLDMELQYLEFALLVFSLVLVPQSLTVSPFLHFEMVM